MLIYWNATAKNTFTLNEGDKVVWDIPETEAKVLDMAVVSLDDSSKALQK